MSTWIVVANRTGARIVERSTSPMELLLVREFENARGRRQDSELNSDAPGLAFASAGSGGGHPMASEESAHDHVARTFAQELGQSLERDRMEHRFNRLVLVAEPRFLGFLREALPLHTATLVEDTITKDLAMLDLPALAQHLQPYVLNSHTA